MVRAPCCEKMGLRKGPWSPEEDQILVNFIKMCGHGNWRALPKLAGLLRCGKSCRLRWLNYLKPDIRRGNFTREEEETIIQMHASMGNRWSAIAARLPGRTDNEIKNVWHTHLKKRVKKQEKQYGVSDFHQQEVVSELKEEVIETSATSSSPVNLTDINSGDGRATSSSQISYNEISSVNTRDMEVLGKMEEMDEGFWSEIFSGESAGEVEERYRYKSSMQYDDMKFWFNVFTRGDGSEDKLLFSSSWSLDLNLIR